MSSAPKDGLLFGAESVMRKISPATFPATSNEGNTTRSGMMVPSLVPAILASSMHLIFCDVVPSGFIFQPLAHPKPRYHPPSEFPVERVFFHYLCFSASRRSSWRSLGTRSVLFQIANNHGGQTAAPTNRWSDS